MELEPEAFALVVGGGSGIGAALVEVYRANGTPVVVWDVDGPHDVRCDVASPDAVDGAVAETRARWGVPSWVTVTAGVGHAGLLVDVDPDEFDRVLRVNARGPLLCMRAWVSAMVDAGRGGSFVTTSSISARVPDRTMGVYCASKAALSMLTRVAAVEWGHLGIRVNAVAPGVTRTPMLGRPERTTPEASPWLAGVAERTALGRLGEPGDVAEAVVALHAMTWVTGQVLEVDGGLGQHSPADPYGAMQRAGRRAGAPPAPH